jgi:hypothetical protein
MTPIRSGEVAPRPQATPDESLQVMSLKAPGLIFNHGGPRANSTAYWRPTLEAKRAGFPLKNVRLSGSDEEIVERCHELTHRMRHWLAEATGATKEISFDGTVGSLIDLYRAHPDSSYQRLKRSSRGPYDTYARQIRKLIGKHQIGTLTGLDLKRWHDAWSRQGKNLGAGAMMLAVLKASLSFGVMCGLPGCQQLHDMASHLRTPKPKPRQLAPSAADVEAARRAAHELGHRRAALGYALQFDACLRAWDVIGQWHPIDATFISDITWRRTKWTGPTWADIDGLVLKLTPSKTAMTTGKAVVLDLSEMPMVMEEIALIPEAERVGPLIISPRWKQPYSAGMWRALWSDVRERAGLPKQLWNRDLRAGGVTEGGKAGASSDDRAKVAGHSKPRITASVYDRDTLEAARRVSRARKAFRANKPETNENHT